MMNTAMGANSDWHRTARRMIGVVAAVALLISAAWQQAVAQDNAAARDFFERRIRPVLVERCYECHSGESKILQGGLRLDYAAGLSAGGDSGPAVVAGQPEESLLIEALRYESFEMPPEGQLSDEVVDDFVRWIRDGAIDPRVDAPALARADEADLMDHWAWRPITSPSPPVVMDKTWPLTAIDRFILARHAGQGLQAVATAPPEAVVRRLFFDLIGLPPTPEEVRAFVADPSPAALAELVDRLLASPQYGERWGRHWLDVARYAESSGGGRSVLFANAWRYRDYVIAAFNDDKPYNQFVVEQIAGDLLSGGSLEEQRAQLVATGFLMLGPKNLDQQDKELLRMEVIDEQLDTIGRAFLGLTIGCARCHDHKFDPIPTRDYYALAGILRSTKTLLPGNVSGFVERRLPQPPGIEAELIAHETQRQQLQERLDKTTKQLTELRAQEASARLARLEGIVVDDTDAQLVGKWQPSSHTKHYVGDGYLHDEAKSKGAKQVIYMAELPQAGTYEVRVSFSPGTNRAQDALYSVEHAEGLTQARVDQTEFPSVDGLFESLGTFEFADATARVVLSNEGTQQHVIADAVQFVSVPAAGDDVSPADTASGEAAVADEDDSEPTDLALIARRVEETADQVRALREEIKALDSSTPPRPLAMAVAEEEQIEDCPLCVRGNVHNLGEPVPRGFLSALPGGEAAEIEDDASGRLELARWLVRDDNPLVARVAANRIWGHLLGEGLVRTPDNFGRMGERPTHPELLDWLATQFVTDGWSIKSLVREIVLSRVYQLGSQADLQSAAIDPENRFYWRMHRRPLEVEALRDAMLSIAGRLESTQRGPTIREGTESEFNYAFDGRRRGLYWPVFRNALDGMYEVFDFADPNIVLGRRNRSVLPTQALYLLNSPFVMEQAEAAAERLLARVPDDESEQIEQLYLETLSRRPTDSERELARRWLSDASGTPRVRLASLYQGLFASIDFRFLR